MRRWDRAVPRLVIESFFIKRITEMPIPQSGQYDTRGRKGALSSFSDSEDEHSLRRKRPRRTREPSGDRGDEYDRRRSPQSPIDQRQNLRPSRDSQRSMELKRSSRDQSNEPERLRRRYSSSPERPRRDYRNKQRSPRQYDREHRSISPPSRSYEHKEPPKQQESRSRRQRPSSLNRRRRSSREPRERTKNRSRSPSRPKYSSLSAAPSPTKRVRNSLPSQQDDKTLTSHPTQDIDSNRDPPPAKQKPNFAPSGKLAAETNRVANTSIVLKYNEPPAARLPPASAPWRLYIFKGDSLLETLPLHTRSCWLFGRERLVVDCPIDHPSCSKQHAVIQFRFVEVKSEHGDKAGRVKPYIIDLESANGTKVNGDLIPERRYVELKSKDVVTFGESTREYVLVLPPKG